MLSKHEIKILPTLEQLKISPEVCYSVLIFKTAGFTRIFCVILGK